ncbi:MAG: hypothetical protein IM585_02110 [Pseudanabaena sp. M135S2SP2A07QC]|nr:hypothetical protein [Pseudanabaena sp. M172S2SP2A07QC]MCA6529903.1 hypothetical protein [Pseudanabaena sp. M125S2SP2A07QC]MCA6532690.1 hypothetical protein [Pseudanabaena sp. M176S2SP2A07QC]MCA6539890.1 hypothetical protein [Pseudanabaena sp. M037S2SP2A07QC]MCA6545347.1 hypothetical protein [Pseudanabaena sp. M074S1SP2A07QC]MCA6547395.1 hypothetical protein [Pseudanabaena sp. M152S2SP2A07QC]MCA6550821.1 hypothetical protein [Pseudanabaena sp. M135S2SP2A07QC]MCA6559909.1 hypothetical prot
MVKHFLRRSHFSKLKINAIAKIIKSIKTAIACSTSRPRYLTNTSS